MNQREPGTRPPEHEHGDGQPGSEETNNMREGKSGSRSDKQTISAGQSKTRRGHSTFPADEDPSTDEGDENENEGIEVGQRSKAGRSPSTSGAHQAATTSGSTGGNRNTSGEANYNAGTGGSRGGNASGSGRGERSSHMSGKSGGMSGSEGSMSGKSGKSGKSGMKLSGKRGTSKGRKSGASAKSQSGNRTASGTKRKGQSGNNRTSGAKRGPAIRGGASSRQKVGRSAGNKIVKSQGGRAGNARARSMGRSGSTRTSTARRASAVRAGKR